MPEEKELKIRIQFDIEGDVARAFVEEQTEILKRTKSISDAAKSTIGRAALVEYLNARNYNVEDASSPWGGSRRSEEGEDPQGVAVAVA